MFTNRFFYVFLVFTLFITACTPQVPATSNPTSFPVVTPTTQDQPVTLHLAVADAQQNPSGPYVLEFIQQVKTLSNGDITIEPVWQAGDDTDAGFEIGVIQLVKKGDMELGLAASRAFDNESITSFQALQAPFLITDDNLAKAVATSNVSVRMLDNLTSSGLVGLTLWPEDLRHPFSIVPDKPLTSPKDFAGLNIRTTPSVASNKLMEALGGKPIYADSDYQGAESGLRQGYSLTGTTTATGNVTFFTKYQVLFANEATFKKLSDKQRAILQDAAMATQKKALAEHPSEVEAGTAWCADGGTIVLASDEQVAAFQTAAQPVLDVITQNTFNAESITAIRELKTKTTPSSGAQACAPAAQANSAPTTEPGSQSVGLPPNGTWQVELTVEDFARMNVSQSRAEKWGTGVYTWTFKDGKAQLDWKGHATTPPYNSYSCQADATVAGDVVRLTYKTGVCEGIEEIQWSLDENGLHFHLVSAPDAPLAEVTATYEAKPWQKIADQ